MRFAVVLLVVLGLVAALCATVLVRVLVRPRPVVATQADDKVQLLVATKSLPAMTIVDATATAVTTVKTSEAPEGALTNAVQVVGKVLTRPMTEGEVFSKSCFSADQGGVFFAATIAEGKRAVTISLQDHNGMAGILYPGSVVDVLVTVLGPGNNAREAVATTLLQGVQVVGVGSQTVATDKEFKDKNPGALANKGQINYRMVTLLVTPKQAEILQLATKFGSISLAMRNPKDTEPVRQELTKMSDFTGGGNRMGTNILKSVAAMLQSVPVRPPAPAAPAATPAPPDRSEASAKEQEPNPLWEILVLHGDTRETRAFPMSDVKPIVPRPAVEWMGQSTTPGTSADPHAAAERNSDVPGTTVGTRSSNRSVK